MDEPDRFVDAVVVRTLPNAMVLVEFDGGRQAAVHASGSMRVELIRVVPGDRVKVELSPFDGSKGRIVARRSSSPPVDRSDPQP